MNKITKRVLSIALVFPLLYGNNFVHAEAGVNLPGSSVNQRVDVEKVSGWNSLNMAQKVAAIGVPSAVGAILLGCVIGHFCTNGKELSVVLIGGNEETQRSVVNILRRRASRKGVNSKVADVLSYVVDEKREQISGESHPLGERFIKSDKWKIHSISADGNGVIIDNPKNSELIGKADVIIVVSDNVQSTSNIHKSIGKDTPKPLYKDGALVVHVGDRFKKSKDIMERLAAIENKEFLAPTVNINNCQYDHTSAIPYGEGEARSRSPFSRPLVLSHLNEALRLNHQGVQFDAKFFQDCVLPQWREEVKASRADLNAVKELSECEKKQMTGIPAMRRMFNSNKFLKSLKPGENARAEYPTLEDYIFGPWKGHDKTRIESLKDVDPELYNMFWDELAWINGNQKQLDSGELSYVDPTTGERMACKDCLFLQPFALNGECDTEFRSFIERVGQILDDMSLIMQGRVSVKMDKDELTKRILTSVRNKCRERLAQDAASDMVKKNEGKGVEFIPEWEALLRYRFALALNLPDTKVAEGNEESVPVDCDVVYSTNILSSIMNIKAIASVATDFARGLDMANNLAPLLAKYDDTISYDECCKILDRSARHMLKGDKRSFDARFRSAVEQCACNGVDHDDLDWFCNWINGTNKESFSDVCATLVLDLGDDDSNKSLVPEVYCPTPEKFGCLNFIKHLVDQRYIVLK